MIRRLVYLFLLAPFAFNSCVDPPELDPQPSIKLNSYFFKPANQFQDSLIIELSFQDGDGDLGLISFDTLPPYHEMDSIIKFDNSGYVKLEDKDTPEYDTLPPYSVGQDCRHWETIRYRSNGTIFETVFYVNRNPHHFNYHLDILVDNGNGFEVYDFLDERCTAGLSGRFFPLNTSDIERPLEGTLRYGIQASFKLLFPTQSLKLRISIEDRKLNRSNVVETEPFKL